MIPSATLRDRFSSKVKKTSTCWLWTGALYRGYGHLWEKGRQLKAHRISWFLHHGFFPTENTFVCHKCDVRNCVNPAHLFLGTHSDNMVDSVIKKRHRNSKKTHCPKGHEYTPENAWVSPRGNRKCRICDKIRQRQYRRNKNI